MCPRTGGKEREPMPKLTNIMVASLKPAEKRYEVSDIVPGLVLRVTPNGTKTYVVRYRFGAKICRLTVGRADDISLSDARDIAREALKSVRSGINPAAEKKENNREKADNAIFLKDAVSTFLNGHVKFLKSKHEIERMLVKDIIPALGDIDIKTITRHDVLNLTRKIKNGGHDIYANRIFACLRSLFRFCVENEIGGIQISPLVGLRLPAKERKRERVLLDDELALIWLASEKLSKIWGTFFKMLILTGARRAEVAEAKWAEFDFNQEKPTWTLSEKRTKNGRVFVLPISPFIIDILNGIPKLSGCDYVFTVTGKTPIIGFSDAKERLEGQVKILVEKMGIQDNHLFSENWRIHDIRRTVATGMARIGIQPHVIEAALNHVSGAKAGVAGIYNRYSYFNEKTEAFTKWQEHVVNICNAMKK